MNDAVNEIYSLVLQKGWSIVDTKEEGAVRIVMIALRSEPKSPPTGIISRGGKKLTGTQNYPAKVFYFNTASGEAHALTMTDLANVERSELIADIAKHMDGYTKSQDPTALPSQVLM